MVSLQQEKYGTDGKTTEKITWREVKYWLGFGRPLVHQAKLQGTDTEEDSNSEDKKRQRKD